MPANEQNTSHHDAFIPASSAAPVSAIIPARNEEAVIATCKQIAPNALGLADATGGNKREMEDLIDAADALTKKAERILKAEHGE